MSQENAIQVSQARVTEIFQGKASTAIKDLMVENAQLQAIVESLNVELQDLRSQVRAHNQRNLGVRAFGNESSPPEAATPQDPASAP